MGVKRFVKSPFGRSLPLAALYTALITGLILAGCSMPVMELAHTARIDTTYAELGPIKITEFEDLRPIDEIEEGKMALNTLSAQIWSGATDPDIMVYFRNVMSAEAKRTKLFTENGPAEFELSGEVLSMKVERKVTIVRYLALVPLLAGILASDTPDDNYFWVGLAGFAALTALEFPLLTATVHYRALLTHNGTPVFDQEIHVTQRSRYWGFTEWSWGSVSGKASTVLDAAITQSVADLFRDIETELNASRLNDRS